MISVITVTWNAEHIVEETIRSVCQQKNKEFEFLLIDGDSTDGTVDKVRALLREGGFPERNTVVVSERDRGVFDAMNKGVGRCKGDYVLFLNGGDRFYNENVIDHLESSIAATPADAIYGRTMMQFYEGRGIYTENERQGDPIMPFIHQSAIVKTSILKRHPFDLSYKVVADREFFYWMRQQGMRFKDERYIVSTYDAREGLSESSPYLIAIEGDRITGRDKEPGYWLRRLKFRLTKAPIQFVKNHAPRKLLNWYFLHKRKNIEWVETY